MEGAAFAACSGEAAGLRARNWATTVAGGALAAMIEQGSDKQSVRPGSGLAEQRRCIECLEGAPQHDQRVGVEVLRPRFGELDNLGLTRCRVRVVRREPCLNAIGFQCGDAHLGESAANPALVVVPTAVPMRVLSE